MGPLLGGYHEPTFTDILNLFDLILDQAQPCHIPLELGLRVRGNRLTIRCAQAVQTLGRLAQVGLKPRMPSRGHRPLQPGDQAGAFFNQGLVLSVRTLGHPPQKGLGPRPCCNGSLPHAASRGKPLEQPSIQPIGLGPSMFARHRNAR